MLVPQDGQRAGRAAQVRAPGGEEGPGADPGRRGQGPRPSRGKAFQAAYGAKFPKAVAKITADLEELLAFYDYPCEHWVHLRTTNPTIESTFAAVRHRNFAPVRQSSRRESCRRAYRERGFRAHHLPLQHSDERHADPGMIHPSKRRAMPGVGSDRGQQRQARLTAARDVVDDDVDTANATTFLVQVSCASPT